MRLFLIMLFTGILVLMLTVTVNASRERHVFDNGHLLQDQWFVATLIDAYCGFVTFYLWVAFREPTWAGKGIWFVLIMALGNMAMSAYMLIALWSLKPGEPLENMLKRKAPLAKTSWHECRDL